SCLTVNQLIGSRSLSHGSCEICRKIFQSILWPEERACRRAILVERSKLCSAARQQSSSKRCASTRQSAASLFRSEPWIPLLRPLAFRMRKHFSAHSSAELEPRRVAT